MKINILATLALLFCGVLTAQIPGQSTAGAAYYWKVLSKVTTKGQFNAETGEVNYVPVFSKYVKDLKGKEVILTGYILPVEAKIEGSLTISAFPFSSCYFCGGAGPETVVILIPKFPIIHRPNKPVVVKGRLKLNEPYDPQHLYYTLLDAEPYFED